MSEIFSDLKIPDSWIWAKSKEIGFVINGDRGKNYPSRQHYISSGIPFLSAGNLSKGRIDLDRLNYISEDKFNALNNGKLQKGDIIYCLRGTLGKCAAFELDRNAAIASSLAILRPSELLNRKYLLYFLQGPFGSKLIKHFDNGTAQPNLSGESFSNYDFPISPLPEQHRIVSKIEALFSSLDKGIESLKTAQQQLKVYRQAVLKWAFDGKLTNDNVKDGELPDGWKWVKVQDIVEKNRHSLKAGPFGSSLKKECYVEQGYKIYGQEQVISGNPFYGDYYINLEKYNELSSNKIKPLDVLISLVGTVGKVLILPENCIDGIINPRLIKISLDTKIYSPVFFKYYFESSKVKSIYSSKAQGTTMDVLNLGMIKTIPFPLAPLAEQQAIVSEIESRLSVCDKLEESITYSLKQAEALRQSILKKAFEGKLVSQDPSDEPANVLLEHIKAEKEKNKPEKMVRLKKVKI